MNTRSTRRTTVPTRAKQKPVAASKAKPTLRVTRRQQQKVAQSRALPQEEEEKVVETTGEEVVDGDVSEKDVFTEEEGIQQAEEVVVHQSHVQLVEEDGHHQQIVHVHIVEEDSIEDQELMEEEATHSQQEAVFEEQVSHQTPQEVVEVMNNSQHIVVMEQSSEQMTGHELADNWTDYWSEEKSQIDGKLEFVCKWLLCSFRTQSECSIRKHSTKHQKPYQCSFVGCGQRFTETQDLLEHFGATHMDTNAFKCTFADCDQRFRDIKALTEHRVTHVSHTTQLIKANKDYKPVQRSATTTQAIDLQQIFGQTFDNTTTIQLTGNMISDQQFIVVTDGVVGADGQTHSIVVTTQEEDRYRNKQRMNSVIRCPLNALTDAIVEGNDNYVKCRSADGKFWYKCLWDYCDYGNINEGIIRRHVLKHEFPHKCSFEACNKSFTTLSEMAEHRQMTHSGPNPYVCDWPDCTDAFPGMKDLTEHKRNHLNEANALSGTGSQGRNKKAKQLVTPKPFTCDFGKCNMHYATEEELDIHKQIHSGDRPFKCQYPECTFAAKSKDKLQIHHSRHSIDKMYRCLWPTCDKSFTIAEQLRRHRKLHTQRDQLICEFTGCDLEFQSALDLERHLRRHIGLDDNVVESLNPMPYKCDFGLCKMHFQTEEELQKHSQSHRGDRYYKCNFDNKCSYSAKTLDKLNAHLRYHSGERPFKCDFIGCHQDFIQSHHLARHRKTHFGAEQTSPALLHTSKDEVKSESEDSFHCQYCDQSFDDESGIEQHMTDEHSVQISDTETDVKPKIALKRKANSSNLSKADGSAIDLPEIDLESEDGPQEKQSKTTRKPRKSETSGQTSEPSKSIACTFGKCNFRCVTDQELTEHMDKLHSGDRPFVCEYTDCTFKTNRKDKLTLHIRRHTGEKPFKCDWNECDKSFICKEQLNRHNLTHFKSKQTLSKMELIDKDFDKTLQELEELLQENDNND